MKILITNGWSRLSQSLADALSAGHDVTLTSRTQVSISHRFVQSDLGHGAETNDLVKGVDVIIHSGETPSNASASDRLDAAMRCTYNLLWAASQERVPRFIYLGSLSVMNRYSEELTVTERWMPAPATEVTDLTYHLAEFACREFAREKKIPIFCLRLGELTWNGAGSTSALRVDDATQAIERALTARIPSHWTDESGFWSVLHVQSDASSQRYLTAKAQQTLGYSPVQRGM